MSKSSVFVYNPKSQKYHFSDSHPFQQKRIESTLNLLKTCNAIQPGQIHLHDMATIDELLLAHDPQFIDVVKQLQNQNSLDSSELIKYGLSTEDIPLFPNMHEAASWIVGGTVEAAKLVCEGKADHVLHLAGGLHHGFHNKANGFCIYNDISVAIEYITKNYGYRVLYIDTDAHHGDGVQWNFYDRPDVCTVSIHEDGQYLYPYTGRSNERGKGAGYGFSFNVPIFPYTSDESFIQVYSQVIREVAEYFKPDILITQNGVDAHFLDPLTHLSSTIQTFEQIPKIAHQIAHEYCGGKWIALGGGGYNFWEVVPKAWALIWLEMNEKNKEDVPIPDEWFSRCEIDAGCKVLRKWDDSESLILPEEICSKSVKLKNQKAVEDCLKYLRNYLKYI